ncbi:MAG: hypothetical protein A2W00_05360 [Candidatus Eisenbacteria bacterium RBG_16_71_46]|nr:MAG: hypothetical protein A2W00_05360 [Candidatus Eisenbacteria bacterium RBG_16_71_46]
MKLGLEDVARAVLDRLGDMAGVGLSIDDPDIGNHLAGVWMEDPTYIMLNASRLNATPDRVVSVVLHEAMHIRQARLGQTSSTPGLEEVADCAAIELGATWTWYARDCSTWVDEVTALIPVTEL